MAYERNQMAFKFQSLLRLFFFNHYLDLILLNHKVAASSKDQEELEQK